ncbi:tetratricopeptide repeat protein [Candidatus Dojkabacteria bacterium]|nr:tetratricopeptide repeat protein [Candidatus Dojkabacteria bacterium]
MMEELNFAIKSALSGERLKGGGVDDFKGDSSAIKKATNVIRVANTTGFDLSKTAIISLGGADGSEIEYILKNSNISKGVMIELDDDLASLAKNKIQNIQKSGKELKVFTGDIGNKIAPALKQIEEWRSNNNISSLIVSIHALLHELPNRGEKTEDIEGILARFIHKDYPVQFVVREPCAPRDLPSTVYLKANCNPKLLSQLSLKIKNTHPYVFPGSPPVPFNDSVRMSSRLAVETIVKIFYLNSFAYELEEVVTFFTRDELLDVFRRVFGTDNVRHTDLQSDSFDRFWNIYRFNLSDRHLTELSKPQLHISIEAKWTPDDKSLNKKSDSDELSDSKDKISLKKDAKLTKKVPITPTNFNDIDLPDIFTPGVKVESIYEMISSFLGEEKSEQILNLSKNGIKAVEDGDFKQQAEIGEKLIEVAGDFSEFHASGLYYAAEGYRLLADINEDATQRDNFREIAKEYYKEAMGIAPNAASAYRGLGRIHEIEGDYDKAMRLFEAAQGIAITGLAAGRSLQKAPALAHEILRTSRHRIHCILGMLSSNPKSEWHREIKRMELEGDIAKADDLHQQYMKLFKSNPRWMYIESFMAMVFLAKAWGSVGHTSKAMHYYLEALHARRRLINSDNCFSEVEVSNLQWWIDNIRSTANLPSSFKDKVEHLSSMLKSQVTQDKLLLEIDNMVETIVASRNIISISQEL